MATCTTCYKDWISCGVEALIVNGTLLSETSYTWKITTAQGAKYLGAASTDEDGFFVIPFSEFPAGFFNPYAGLFTLEVQTGNCTPVQFNDSAYCEPYACIEFSMANGSGDKNIIGCPCLADSEDCCFPEVFEFTDATDMVIPYTTEMAAKYGDVPTVQVWIYDVLGRLVYTPGIFAELDAVPATTISLDFGGVASGIVVVK